MRLVTTPPERFAIMKVVYSLRLLRLHSSFLQIIKDFSLMQRLHFLLILLYGLSFHSILHLTLKGLFAFLNVQMYTWIAQSRSVSCGFGRMMCGFCIVL